MSFCRKDAKDAEKIKALRRFAPKGNLFVSNL
jgi:hypothetical protein